MSIHWRITRIFLLIFVGVTIFVMPYLFREYQASQPKIVAMAPPPPVKAMKREPASATEKPKVIEEAPPLTTSAPERDWVDYTDKIVDWISKILGSISTGLGILGAVKLMREVKQTKQPNV